MRSRDGAWVGWHGAPDEELAPFTNDGIKLVPVTLSSREVADYYEGFSNATLWPLYHDVIATPEFHREWWDAYVTVNQRFADQTAQVAGPGAVVWVQDYQLQLVPQMLRAAAPRPADRVLPAHPFPADRALPAAALAQPDPGGHARRRPGRIPAGRRGPELRPAGSTATPAGDASRPGTDHRRPHGGGPGLPDRHRRQGPARSGRQPRSGRAGGGHPSRPGRSALAVPRGRPARLHQGPAGTHPRVRRAGRRGQDRSRRSGPGPARDPRPANGSTSTGSCGTKWTGWSAGSTATSDGSADRS